MMLVIVGILIAVSLNNRNIERQQIELVETYLQNIVAEISSNIAATELQFSTDSALAEDNRKILRILRDNRLDSIKVLEKLIGSTAVVAPIVYSFPNSEEFMNSDLISTHTPDAIRKNFIRFSYMIEEANRLNDYNLAQYQEGIEPFFRKHINYANSAHITYQEQFIKGGPETNLTLLFDNLEFWNLVTFKLEQLTTHMTYSERCIEFLEKHKREIEVYLEK